MLGECHAWVTGDPAGIIARGLEDTSSREVVLQFRERIRVVDGYSAHGCKGAGGYKQQRGCTAVQGEPLGGGWIICPWEVWLCITVCHGGDSLQQEGVAGQ